MFERVGVLVGFGMKVRRRLKSATLVRLGRPAHSNFSSRKEFVDSFESETGNLGQEEVAAGDDQGVEDRKDDLWTELSVFFFLNLESISATYVVLVPERLDAYWGHHDDQEVDDAGERSEMVSARLLVSGKKTYY